MADPVIELLWCEGCPSHPRALADLRAALDELGLAARVEVREVRTQAEAEALGFAGSPTLRVAGDDLLGGGGAPSLTCRVYRRRDGRASPTPDPDDLRDALRGMLSA